MSKIPFHKQCAPFIEHLVKHLDVTSAWVCKIDVPAETTQVLSFGVAPSANPMEKVSDLFEEYDINKTPKFKNWVVNQPQDNLIFQIKTMPINDPDRREYIINQVNTVLFAPIYLDEIFWGVLEIWETRQPRDYTESDVALIKKTVNRIIHALEN